MTLIERDGKFYSVNGRQGMGLTFRCPCQAECTERVAVAFVNPLDHGEPDTSISVRWTREGSALETLTLHPSIDFRHADEDGTKRRWHGHLINGELRTAE